MRDEVTLNDIDFFMDEMMAFAEIDEKERVHEQPTSEGERR